MTGVGITINDEDDEPIGAENSWDLYGQLREGISIIDYWAVNTADGSVAYADIPKWSSFIHFSPCGDKFSTMDISGRSVTSGIKVTASFYSTAKPGDQTHLGRPNFISP